MMTDVVLTTFDTAAGPSDAMSPPGVGELAAHVQALQEAVGEATVAARAAAIRSEEVESDYQRALGSASLDERLASFETFLVQKVRSELQSYPSQFADGVAGPALVITTGKADQSHDDVAARHTQAQQRIASEALRAKTAALEQRQSVLEGKLNALVSDFVLTNQTNHNEMRVFGDNLRTQLRRHKEEVREKVERSSAASPTEREASALIEMRMGEMVRVMGHLDVRTQETQSSLDAAEEQWFAVMARLVDKMSEVTVRVGQLEEDLRPPHTTATVETAGDSAISQPLHVHLRVVEEAMCHFADDLENLRGEVRNHLARQRQPAASTPETKVAAARGSVQRSNTYANAAAQLLAAQLQHRVRARFFHAWKGAVEAKVRREKDEMILSVLRAHQEEINHLKARMDNKAEQTKKSNAARRENSAGTGAALKELQKCIRVAVADKGNPPSVHVCRALQAFGSWAEQVEHSFRPNAS